MDEKQIQKYQEHYTENKLSGKLVKVAKRAGQKIVYAVLLLYYVLGSPDKNIKF